jgi:hypothetical protein
MEEVSLGSVRPFEVVKIDLQRDPLMASTVGPSNDRRGLSGGGYALRAWRKTSSRFASS